MSMLDRCVCVPQTDLSKGLISSVLRAAQLAVKLVHRSKTPTTAARVRALWTEYKCAWRPLFSSCTWR